MILQHEIELHWLHVLFETSLAENILLSFLKRLNNSFLLFFYYVTSVPEFVWKVYQYIKVLFEVLGWGERIFKFLLYLDQMQYKIYLEYTRIETNRIDVQSLRIRKYDVF